MQTNFEDIPDGALITAIEPVANDPGRHRIVVDGKVIAKLERAVVSELNLFPGLRWSAALGRRLRHTVAITRAKLAAFDQLDRRALTQEELRTRLIEREHPTNVVDHVVDELHAKGWLDDAGIAEAEIRRLLEAKPAGRDLLIAKVLARRIPLEIAERVVDEALVRRDPVHDAVELASQRLRSMGIDEPTAARRISGMLGRRGFDAEVIATALEQLGLCEHP